MRKLTIRNQRGLLMSSARHLKRIALTCARRVKWYTGTIRPHALPVWQFLSAGRVVRGQDLRLRGCGFKSRPLRCRLQPWPSCLHTCASVTEQYNLILADGQWCSAAEAWRQVMAAYRRAYGFGHLRADCRGPGSALEYGLRYLLRSVKCSKAGKLFRSPQPQSLKFKRPVTQPNTGPQHSTWVHPRSKVSSWHHLVLIPTQCCRSSPRCACVFVWRPATVCQASTSARRIPTYCRWISPTVQDWDRRCRRRCRQLTVAWRSTSFTNSFTVRQGPVSTASPAASVDTKYM